MLILFFDSKEVVHKEFVPESQMVATEFYLKVLGHLLKHIARVRSEVWKIYSFNLLNNAPAQTATIVQQFLTKNKKKALRTISIWSSGLFWILQIENGIERRSVQKYLTDLKFHDGEIENNTYS